MLLLEGCHQSGELLLAVHGDQVGAVEHHLGIGSGEAAVLSRVSAGGRGQAGEAGVDRRGILFQGVPGLGARIELRTPPGKVSRASSGAG